MSVLLVVSAKKAGKHVSTVIEALGTKIISEGKLGRISDKKDAMNA